MASTSQQNFIGNPNNTADFQVINNASITTFGNLTVTDQATVAGMAVGDLAVGRAIIEELGVTNDTRVTGSVSVTGAVSAGSVSVTGTVNADSVSLTGTVNADSATIGTLIVRNQIQLPQGGSVGSRPTCILMMRSTGPQTFTITDSATPVRFDETLFQKSTTTQPLIRYISNESTFTLEPNHCYRLTGSITYATGNCSVQWYIQNQDGTQTKIGIRNGLHQVGYTAQVTDSVAYIDTIGTTGTTKVALGMFFESYLYVQQFEVILPGSSPYDSIYFESPHCTIEVVG